MRIGSERERQACSGMNVCVYYRLEDGCRCRQTVEKLERSGEPLNYITFEVKICALEIGHEL